MLNDSALMLHLYVHSLSFYVLHGATSASKSCLYESNTKSGETKVVGVSHYRIINQSTNNAFKTEQNYDSRYGNGL
jgi:hypothetical protein